METIRDVLYIKTLERILKRKLTEEEMSGEPFAARMPNGSYRIFQVPLLLFPEALLKDFVEEDSSSYLDFVDYAS